MSIRPVLGMALASVLLVPRPAWALDPDKPLGRLHRRGLGRARGLPSSFVRAIAQTPDGYLWIAGYGGVGRYDGARIVSLPEPKPLAHIFDTITSRWTRRARCGRSHRRGRRCACATASPGDCLPSGVDAAAGVTGWSTPTPSATGRPGWRRARSLPLTCPVHRRGCCRSPRPALGRVAFVHRDRAGRLWLGSEHRPVPAGRATASSSSVSAGGRPGHAPVRAMFETPQGRLWFLIDRGLLRIEGEQARTFTALAASPTTGATPVMEDRDGNVWIGTRAGLVRFRRTAAGSPTPAADGLPDDHVTALFEDREGSLWVGTRSGGIAQFTDRVVAARPGPPSLREAQRVNSVARTDRRRTGSGPARAAALARWTDGRGAARSPPRTGCPTTEVLAVAPGAGGELWVGTARGLARGCADGRIDVPARRRRPGRGPARRRPGTVWLAGGDRLLRFRERPAGAGGAVAAWTRSASIEPDDAGRHLGRRQPGRGPLVEGDLTARGALPGGEHPGRALHRDTEGRLWLVTGDGHRPPEPGAHPLPGADGRPSAAGSCSR